MEELVIGGIYKHFKGNEYIVRYIGKDCSNIDNKLVIYESFKHIGEIWVRPLKEFIDIHETGVKRFTFLA